MIITKQMIESLESCAESAPDIEAFIAAHGDNREFNFVVDTLIAEGMRKWALWLRGKKLDFMKMSDDFRFGGYRVTNPLNQEVTLCETIEQAQATRHAIKQYFLVSEAHRFAANQEIEHENGDVTWLPVDLDACEYEDRYQVFNQATGTYELCETLADAKAKFAEIKEQCAEQNVQAIQQQIISGDESAWVTVKE